MKACDSPRSSSGGSTGVSTDGQRRARRAPVDSSKSQYPRVVLEIGFSTSSNDRKKIQDESIQAAVAKAVADGVREFFQ